MKTAKYILGSLLFMIQLIGCDGQKDMLEYVSKTLAVSNESQCDDKDGYWYKGKCWANFKEFDDGISKIAIDSFVEDQLRKVENYKIVINEQPYEINLFMQEEDNDDNMLILFTVFNQEGSKKTLLQFASLDDAENKSFDTKAILVNGDINEMDEAIIDAELSNPSITGELTTKLINKEENHYSFNGIVTDKKTNQKYSVHFQASDLLTGIGDTQLTIKGDKAFLNGTLGTKGYSQFKDLIKNHPEVKTIVLENVPGSLNDAVNMHTGRIIREAGLNTMVLSNSKISSGGVDLFCAGNERIVIEGAQLGIHSWGGEGISAGDLPKDHPAHQYQIAYFTMCLGKEIGPSFYFRTLTAATAEDMYWMKDDEIREKVATKFITK